MDDHASVAVAVRIRPLVPREEAEGCQECLDARMEEGLIKVNGTAKKFVFDYVVDQKSSQAYVYNTCVTPLLDSTLKGYNSTVLAYGQTGSGKTFTMGSEVDGSMENGSGAGVLPRLATDLFQKLDERVRKIKGFKYEILASYLEIYREKIMDLLNPSDHHLPVREDNGVVYVAGLHHEKLSNIDQIAHCLKKGALSRSTGATKMNARSSRSHAIFTLHLKQWRELSPPNPSPDADPKLKSSNSASNKSMSRVQGSVQRAESKTCKSVGGEDSSEGQGGSVNKEVGDLAGLENGCVLTSQFYLVDLAGSERAKRTQARGARLKEGIKINSGLLALGNVISILGDPKKRAGAHVPYRDSKLTRLLQIALGGNSKTLMIACVSPADSSFEETVNTLRYASRARNIQNSVVQNVDAGEEVAVLKRQVETLRRALAEARAGTTSGGGGGAGESVLVQRLKEQVAQLTVARDQWRFKYESLTNSNVAQATKGQTHGKEMTPATAAGTGKGPGFEEKEIGILEEQARKIVNLETEKHRLEDLVESVLSVLRSSTNDALSASKSGSEAVTLSLEDITMGGGEKTALGIGLSLATDSDGGPDLHLEGEMDELVKLVKTKAEQIRQGPDPSKIDALRKKYQIALKDLEMKLEKAENERDRMKSVLNKHTDPRSNSKKTESVHVKRLKDKLKTVNQKVRMFRENMMEQRKKLAQADKQRRVAEKLKKELIDAKRQKVILANRIKNKEEELRRERLAKRRQLLSLHRIKDKQTRQLTTLHNHKSRQENVLRRKNEKLFALEKRLRAIVSRRQESSARRTQAQRGSSRVERRHILRGMPVEHWLEKEIMAHLVSQQTKKEKVDRLLETRKHASLESKNLSNTNPRKRRLQTRIRKLSRQISEIQTNLINQDMKNTNPVARLLGTGVDQEIHRAVSWMFDQLATTMQDLRQYREKNVTKRKIKGGKVKAKSKPNTNPDPKHNPKHNLKQKPNPLANSSKVQRQFNRAGNGMIRSTSSKRANGSGEGVGMAVDLEVVESKSQTDGEHNDHTGSTMENTDEEAWAGMESSSTDEEEICRREREVDPDYRETPVVKTKSKSRTRRRVSKEDKLDMKNEEKGTGVGTESMGSAGSNASAYANIHSSVLLSELRKPKVKLTIKDLKLHLHKRGASKQGRKSILVERLTELVQHEIARNNGVQAQDLQDLQDQERDHPASENTSTTPSTNIITTTTTRAESAPKERNLHQIRVKSKDKENHNDQQTDLQDMLLSKPYKWSKAAAKTPERKRGAISKIFRAAQAGTGSTNMNDVPSKDTNVPTSTGTVASSTASSATLATRQWINRATLGLKTHSSKPGGTAEGKASRKGIKEKKGSFDSQSLTIASLEDEWEKLNRNPIVKIKSSKSHDSVSVSTEDSKPRIPRRRALFTVGSDLV